MDIADPSPERTLAILLGVSKLPGYPTLPQGSAFSRSAEDFGTYLTSCMQLPRENVNDRFDDNRPSSDQLKEISHFLATRCEALKQAGTPASDLIVYYVGHGLFPPDSGGEYHLAIRETERDHESFTSLKVSELAQSLRKHARSLRQFLVLDCCFAAQAFREFQAGAGGAGGTLMGEVPTRGVTLLCAASAGDPALTREGLKRTMFSDSLLYSLRHGHPALGPKLSLGEIGDLIRNHLRTRFPKHWARPEVHSPDQREGDVAEVGLFPNPAHQPDRARPHGRVHEHGPPAARRVRPVQADPQSVHGHRVGSSFRDGAEAFYPDLVVVPPGRFQRGSPPDEEGRYRNEGPVREVTIGHAFAVTKYPITRAAWRAYLAASGRAGSVHGDVSWEHPGFPQDDSHPVVCVACHEAEE